MSDYKRLQEQLKVAKEERDTAREAVYQAKEALALQELSQEEAARTHKPVEEKKQKAKSARKIPANLRERLVANLATLETKQALLNTLSEAFDQLGNPQELINNFDDAYPILLTPVRIEARFMNPTVPVAIRGRFGLVTGYTYETRLELWVRIFPDDIHTNTHEPLLTPDEVEAGKAFWTQMWSQEKEIHSGNLDEEETAAAENQKYGAWAVLHHSYGANRAAWIAKRLKPANWPAELSDFAFITAAPIFPFNGQKSNSWTLPPRADLLPDRFVVRVYTGTDYKEVVGKLIPDPLIIGPDPGQAETSFEEEDGKLKVDPEMEWMVDFDKAIENGMGVKIPLTTQEYQEGFDKVLALGIRLSENQHQGRVAVERHINNLHYSPDGFGILPQGTPTNNSATGSAGFSSTTRDIAEAYQREMGAPLIQEDPEKEAMDKSDGEWLAEALGINFSPLEHVPNSNHTDIREALAINHALSPGTVSYYLEQMLDQELTRPIIENTKKFFCKHIRGRGPLPAILVGNQPYGILPATAYSKMTWGDTEEDQIASGIQTVLGKIHEQWETKVPAVKTVQDTGAYWQQIFMEIQTLHPTSVEFFSQYLLGPWLHWNLRRFYNQDDTAVSNWWQQHIWNPGEDIRSQLGLFSGRPFMLDNFYLESKVWLKGDLIDENPLSETAPLLKKYDGQSYIQWLYNEPLITIWTGAGYTNEGITIPPSRSLLYLLLRHAYLRECLDTAITILNTQGENIERKQKEHLNIPIGKDCDLTHYDILFNSVRISIKEGSDVIDLPSLLTSSHLEEYSSLTSSLLQHKKALRILQDLPTARLERCLVEHLDLCTYRMTDWQTGLVNHRLDQMRFPNSATTRQKGIYTGAYGWLLDLRPKPPRERVPNANTPDAFKVRRGPFRTFQEQVVVNISTQSNTEIDPPSTPVSGPVFVPVIKPPKMELPLTYEAGNAGFIHTPSSGQAVAAAILREGYLSRDGNSMEVNLSSERVRKALQIIQGVQNGQELAALLGYRFERGLHDISEQDGSPQMNHHIYTLREKFPLTANQLIPNESGDSQAEANNVVHGLDLVKFLKDNTANDLGLSFNADPVEAEKERTVINQLTDELNDILDALGDLNMAEGVYQAVLGNFERAGANLNAMTEGKLPPDPQVIETPRTGITVTHRVGLLFDLSDTASRWTNVPPTPRSQTAPYLNYWLSKVLNQPEDIQCIVYIFEAGPDEEATDELEVKLSDLQIQPIDLLAIIGDQLVDDESELSMRIKDHVRRVLTLSDEIAVKIDYRYRANWPLQIKTFYEILPLARNLKKITGEYRYLQAEDFLLSADNTPETISFNLLELWSRIKFAYETLDNLLNGTNNALTTVLAFPDPETDSDALTAFDNLRDTLRVTSAFGIEGAIPKSTSGATSEIQILLEQQRQTVHEQAKERKRAFRMELFTILDAGTANSDDVTNSQLHQKMFDLFSAEELSEGDLVNWLIRAAQKLFGDSFHPTPVFKLYNSEELSLAHAASSTMLLQDAPPMAADEWLYGTAKVRERVQTYQQAALFSDTLSTNKTNFELSPIQLPYQENDRWLGLAYSDEREVFSDTLSLVLNLPDNFAPTPNSYQAGLLFDEWLERIPSKQETTGIAFNYEEPATEPPNVLLLAVPPKLTGHWEWEDLIDTLNETIDLAQKRAVDPYLLEQNPGTLFNHFLPGLVSAISNRPDKMITLNFNQKK